MVVDVRSDDDCFEIRTSNRKYYKKVRVSDLFMNGIKLDRKLLSHHYEQGTLTIKYKKPQLVIDQAKRI